MNSTIKIALEFDKKDKLKHFKNQFINDDAIIYLDGNSLGKLPKKTIQITSNLVHKQWGEGLIQSWNAHWLDLSKNLSQKIAKIVGAHEDEIFIGDSTSLNLYKLAYAALKVNKGKTKILTDSLNFPTDIFPSGQYPRTS